ncbi:hypothetical protein A3A63_01470 [Candidatus Gottesmanbacteria bacterium RIFCSPLOWO2_01_FULL_46_9]|uniref:HAMP domain-containing protein n=1 Tax=Candidatus Gottesmanbacteria bacterium RIFCSPLOWO2_01_FULL_46_9 TaxID=1798394 RepID=A0A1F6AXR7_9BACT|nr:MAG: hypothetical protein A3A63_01470 [Candidatus Gottesmanbacteria bacterium RIFCSPLOWO2_01_FULL_46_9]
MKLASIQYRLLAVIVFSSLCVVMVGALSIVSLGRLSASFKEFTNSHMPVVRSTQQALLSLEDASANVGFALAGDTTTNVEDTRLFEAKYNQAILQFEMFVSALTWGSETKEFHALDGGIMHSAWERSGYHDAYTIPAAHGKALEAAKDMRPHINEFVTKSQQIFAMKKKIVRLTAEDEQKEIRELQKQVQLLAADMRTHKESVTQALQAFVAENDAVVDAELKQQEQLTTSVYAIIASIIGLNVLFSMLFGLYYSRKMILIPLQKLTHVVNDISTGKLDAKIDPKLVESKDEIGDLARAFDRTVVSLKLAMREKEQAGPADAPPIEKTT